MSDLTPAQRELVQRLLRQKLADVRYDRLPHRGGLVKVPLTPAQAGIWFFTQAFPRSSEYNLFDLVRIPWTGSEARLRECVRTLIGRHEALRIAVTVEDGEAIQYDTGQAEPRIEWFDLRALAPEAAHARAEELANAAARVPIRIDEAPLFRITAMAMPDDRTLLLLVLHHLVADFVSMAILIDELTTSLDGGSLAPAPGVGFLDYAAWTAAEPDTERMAVEAGYWRTKLAGELPVLDLPADRPRPAEPTRRGVSVAVTVPEDVVASLKRIAAEERTTLFVVALAVYQLTLVRLSGERDVIVGTAFAGRDHPDVEQMLGCFVRSVALRTPIGPGTSFRRVVRAVHTTVAEAHDHQKIPFERVVDLLGVPRRLDNHPVFQTFFGYQSNETPERPGVELNPITLLDYDSAKWDLSTTFAETGKVIAGSIEGAADLFDRVTVARFRDVYLRLCAETGRAPDRPVGAHALLGPEERRRVLEELNEYRPARVDHATLAGPFEDQARRTPGRTALETASRTLTYRELDEWANRLAHALRAHGVRRGDRVALLMCRSLEAVVLLYAVAKSGAAFVPLDPELPAARLADMIEDVEPRLVIADPALVASVPGHGPVFPFTALDEAAAGRPRTRLAVDGDSGNVSHLLYTSGSTGRPKAVVCSVRTALADIFEMQRRLGYGPDDAVLFKTSYGFDTSLWETFWPLYTGARTVICPADAEKDPVRLIEVIERHRITVVDLTPSVLQAVLEQLDGPRCGSLRYLHTGGEAVGSQVRAAFHARFPDGSTQLVNGYGPTETACVVAGRLDPALEGETVPLGRPHRHARLYVLDDWLNVVPAGVAGEAYVQVGPGLSYGYHRRPELTAQRYLPDPYGPPGSRMYRTGDVCRYRPDGVLEFVGRADSQLKIRGLRVEPAEVEAAFLEHPDVVECVVVAVGEGADKQLAAFVRLRRGAEFDAVAVREQALRSLPSRITPATVQVVDRMPVTVNGKVDRNALRALWRPDPVARRGARAEPANDLERSLAAIYREVLGVPDVGAEDSFFDLGGHSLKVFRLLTACDQQLGVRPRVADVFAAPTVRQLAGRIGAAHERKPETSVVPLRDNPGKPLVILVHASGGSALPFVPLAGRLGDEYSVHAMQARDGETAEDTIEAIAARYAGEVDGIRGMSPVLLAGWSVGGAIALEMARLWSVRGFDVSGVVLLDSWPPPDVFAPGPVRSAVRESIVEMDVVAEEGIDVALAGVADAELDRLRSVIERHRRALLAYRPAPFHGRVHLVRATGSDGRGGRYPGEDYGWGAVLADLVVRSVPGTHSTLVHAENAEPVAAVLREVAADRAPFAEI
ncbi:non-ribosomal peptide synthetase [Amycolatopsis sp. lyj-23]|uniref:non-ribosomal peptide synthetase n=1 Tax=Amycolatopsis sp. lyj-23 TaxID=2789283 RepID=UPI003979F00D